MVIERWKRVGSKLHLMNSQPSPTNPVKTACGIWTNKNLQSNNSPRCKKCMNYYREESNEVSSN